MAALADGVNAFAFHLYPLLRGRFPNVAFSPASIATAFALAYGGARGQTATEIAQTFGFAAPDERFHKQVGDLLASWNAQRSTFTLNVVNRLFGEETAAFEPAYLTLMKDEYRAPLEKEDFVNAAETSRLRINGWVAEETKGLIRDLIPRGMINQFTRLVLVNAIYFKGRWARPFEPGDTSLQPFRTPTGRVEAQTMSQKANFRFTHRPEAQVKVLELPFAGNELAMDILLPDRPEDLAAVESNLGAGTLKDWLSTLQDTELRVLLPRFKVDWKDTDFAKKLMVLGLVTPFFKNADFTGIGPDLGLNEVIHRAVVEVNEEGAAAAAATAIVMIATGLGPPPPPEFRADHPFLFLIRDVGSGMILFLGRVDNPTG